MSDSCSSVGGETIGYCCSHGDFSLRDQVSKTSIGTSTRWFSGESKVTAVSPRLSALEGFPSHQSNVPGKQRTADSILPRNQAA